MLHSMRELLVREAHSGGLMKHFCVKKIFDIFTKAFLLAKNEQRCGKNMF